MGRKTFLIKTKGYCLLCLSKPSRTPSTHDHASEQQEGNEPKIFSLQRVCHYLKLNLGEIVNSSLSGFEGPELKGLLCEDCSELNETFSEITLELEVLRMMLDSVVGKLYDKLEGVEGKREVMEKFRKVMVKTPRTLQHYRMVEELRKEALTKSALMLQKAQPRVILQRLDIMNMNMISTPTPQTENVAPVDEENEKEMGDDDSIPVVAEVQGSYNLSISLDNSIELVTKSVDIDDANLSPHPGSPASLPKGEDDDLDPSLVPKTPGKTHYCKPCNKTFWSNSMKQDHDRVIHQGIRFQCDYCTRSFTFRASWSRHEKEFHNRPRVFKSAKALASSLTLPASVLKAKGGAAPFTAEGKLRQKKMKALNPGKEIIFPCGYCPSVFTGSANRSRHRKRFHRHVGFPKAVARRKKEKKLLKGEDEDQSSGTEEPAVPSTSPERSPSPPPSAKKSPKWKCRICTSIFHSNPERMAHEKAVHKGATRIFLCPFCPASFKCKPTLLVHQQKYHSQEEASQTTSFTQPEKKMKCEYCDKSFIRQRHLRTHITKSHFPNRVERVHECEICHKKFILTSHLARHVRESHLGMTNRL